MSQRSSSETRADALQRDEVVGGEQMQILDQRRHGRIAAVLLLQLQRQAFAQVAGEHAARLEALHHASVSSTSSSGAPRSSASAVEIAAQIAGLVGHVDEMLADQTAGRVGEGEHELLGEMIAQRPLLGDIGLEIRLLVAVGALALARASPSRNP